MIGYHGTPIPERIIREEGLKVLTPERYVDFVVRHLVQPPPRVLKFLRASIGKLSFEPQVAFYTVEEDAEEWATAIPEVLGSNIASTLPPPIGNLVVRAITEIVGDKVIGKVVTVNLPEEWIKDSRVRVVPGGSDSEIWVPWDVGPQYIEKIRRLEGPKVREYLEELEDLR